MRMGILHAIILPMLLAYCAAESIKIGALYGENTHVDDIYKNILTDAQQFINRDFSILPSGDEVSVVHYQPPNGNDWSWGSLAVAIRASCSFINNKDAHTLIIPDDVCLDCGGLGGVIGNGYSPTLATDQAADSRAIKLYPIKDDLIELISGVIKHYRWTTMIYLYDQDSAYDILEELMRKAPEYGWVIHPMVLADDVRSQMRDLKEKAIKNIIVYMHVEENIKTVVDHAYEENVLKDTWHWLFGNPNVASLGKTFLETKLRYNSAFLTRFKMKVSSAVEGTFYTRRPDAIRKWPFRQQLTYDSLLATSYALRAYHDEHGSYPASARCGRTISQLMPYFHKARTFEGCSGEVSFDADGNRVNYTIDIFVGKNQYLSTSKLGVFTQNIDHWERKERSTWMKPGSRLYMKPYRMAEATHIHVLSIEEPPFLMHRDYELTRRPNRRRFRRQDVNPELDLYIGYVPMLLKEIKKVFEEDMGLDFTYRLELLGEGNYGKYDKSTLEWDGMMRDLYDGDADVIAAALTKTDIREEFIDYTSIWYKSDIKLLIKHPSFVWEYPFVPLFPFNVYAWMANFLAFFVATILMWVISRLNQNEWRALSSRGEATEEEGDTFTLYNTTYYMMSIWAFQGYKKSPNSYSGRVFTGFWFAYTLIMVWLYVSNLTPFLKASKVGMKIYSLNDLNKQEQFDYGVVRNSPTYDLFQQSTKGDKRITWDDIQTGDEDKIVQDSIEGVRKVRRDNGRYALLSERKMLEYEAYRWPCDLYVSGGYVTKIKFPLAVQSGSPLRDQLTYAIKKLKKNGVIANITSTSFYKPYCSKSSLWQKQAKKSITGADLAGIYYLMLLGFASSLIMFAVETIYFYLRGNSGVRIPVKSRQKRDNIPLSRNGGGGGGGIASGMGVHDTGRAGTSGYRTGEPEKRAADWL
ncbi:glutamate receptor 2-like [Lytechinus variegatus]|uniref:glutamate receptor 2-like n=1 Tax=Lytechinus variegatus TaxID=7654 RepID=UPI001BB1EA6B|nr:glutamate receptor 2-like [Lytechinus variegatus]